MDLVGRIMQSWSTCVELEWEGSRRHRRGKPCSLEADWFGCDSSDYWKRFVDLGLSAPSRAYIQQGWSGKLEMGDTYVELPIHHMLTDS